MAKTTRVDEPHGFDNLDAYIFHELWNVPIAAVELGQVPAQQRQDESQVASVRPVNPEVFKSQLDLILLESI